jgi:imidazolonepropionase-like amidohydrolase
LRQAIAEGHIWGPRVLTSGWAISQSGGHGLVRSLPTGWVLQHRPKTNFADGADECRQAVRMNFGDGADLVKIFTDEGGFAGGHPQVPNFTLAEIAAMTEEAHRRGARVAAHAVSVTGIRNAVLGGVDTIEHGVELGDDDALIALLVERNVTLVPTLTQHHRLAAEGLQYGASAGLAEAGGRILAKQLRFLARAHQQGLRIAVGTDLGNTWGFGDNAHELELLVQAGLAPMDAIIAATRAGAEALGVERWIGTLDPGKLAEVVILAANPLEEIASLRSPTNIRAVLKSLRPLR